MHPLPLIDCALALLYMICVCIYIYMYIYRNTSHNIICDTFYTACKLLNMKTYLHKHKAEYEYKQKYKYKYT